MEVGPTVVPTDTQPRRIRPAIAMPLDLPSNFKARGELDLLLRTQSEGIQPTVGPDLPTTVNYETQVVNTDA